MTYDPNLQRPVDTQSDREPDAAPSGGSGFLMWLMIISTSNRSMWIRSMPANVSDRH